MLLVVEAMKMEHSLTAPCAGEVTELFTRTGEQVVVDQLLASVTPPSIEAGGPDRAQHP